MHYSCHLCLSFNFRTLIIVICNVLIYSDIRFHFSWSLDALYIWINKKKNQFQFHWLLEIIVFSGRYINVCWWILAERTIIMMNFQRRSMFMFMIKAQHVTQFCSVVVSDDWNKICRKVHGLIDLSLVSWRVIDMLKISTKKSLEMQLEWKNIILWRYRV